MTQDYDHDNAMNYDTNNDNDDASPRSFIHAREFFMRLEIFCKNHDDDNEATLDYLKGVLDNYQNDSHLLEPFLDKLSTGPLEAFKRAFTVQAQPQTTHPSNLYAIYLYWLSKVVTAKILIRYFPHSVADFSLLLSLITSPSFTTYPWEARYILLLWLSLVINIPFSLDKFGQDIHHTLEEKVLKPWLATTGKERDAVALFGSKYFTRSDVGEDRLLAFFNWCSASLQQESVNTFLATGILQFLNSLLQDVTRQNLTPRLRATLYRITSLYDISAATALAGTPNSPLLRRLRAKYMGRLAATYLPPAGNKSRRATTVHVLLSSKTEHPVPSEQVKDVDFDVPEEVDVLLGDLLEALSDSDSRVRWTASKALSRIANQVPLDYIDEIAESVLSLYSNNVIKPNTPEEDLSLVSASTWHGATLCLSSLLRANLLSSQQVSTSLPWILRALTFSQRKGAQKIGSNVRDAACYFAWCLARAESKQGQLTSNEEVVKLSRKLVIVACTDEESTVRRAASAAFQECAGRMPVPDGLDVLLLMDGQIVGSKRGAFLTAAPAISCKHAPYRRPLLDWLHTPLLYHQDVKTRELAAESLNLILQGNDAERGSMLSAEVKVFQSAKESRTAHGSLLLLEKLCQTGAFAEQKAQVFKAYADLPNAFCSGASVALLLPVLGRIALLYLKQEPQASLDMECLDHKLSWRRFLDVAQRRPEASSHEAAGDLIEAVSCRMDCLNDLKRILKSGTSPTSQQCVTAMLGRFDFRPSSACHQLLDITIDRLVKILSPVNTPTCKTMEAKCNALKSLTRIYLEDVDVTERSQQLILEALFEGLEDYTTDQRGEVGSMVRVTCMEQLTTIALAQDKQSQLPQDFISKLITQLVKQSVEKIDLVREQAGRQLERLSNLRTIFSSGMLETWRQIRTSLPAVLQMLPAMNEETRRAVLEGVVTSVGHPPETQYMATEIFLDWVRSLPDPNHSYELESLLRDLLRIAADIQQASRVTVPALYTLATIVEDTGLRGQLQDNAASQECLKEVKLLAERIHRSSKVASKKAASAKM